MKRVILSLIFMAIWIFLFLTIGVNIFSFILGVFFSLLYLAVIAGFINGRVEAKRDMYLANKYDEEYGGKK